eukprot:COSAG05_NODE_1815_length_4034_cov_1.658958_2_plen_188_part_00
MQCRLMAVVRTVGAPSASGVVRATPLLLLPYRRPREPPTPTHAALLLSASAVTPAERWHRCRSVGPTAEAVRVRARVRREAVPRWLPAAAAPALAAAGHCLLPPTDHHAVVIKSTVCAHSESARARERDECVAQCSERRQPFSTVLGGVWVVQARQKCRPRHERAALALGLRTAAIGSNGTNAIPGP